MKSKTGLQKTADPAVGSMWLLDECRWTMNLLNLGKSYVRNCSVRVPFFGAFAKLYACRRVFIWKQGIEIRVIHDPLSVIERDAYIFALKVRYRLNQLRILRNKSLILLLQCLK